MAIDHFLPSFRESGTIYWGTYRIDFVDTLNCIEGCISLCAYKKSLLYLRASVNILNIPGICNAEAGESIKY